MNLAVTKKIYLNLQFAIGMTYAILTKPVSISIVKYHAFCMRNWMEMVNLVYLFIKDFYVNLISGTLIEVGRHCIVDPPYLEDCSAVNKGKIRKICVYSCKTDLCNSANISTSYDNYNILFILIFMSFILIFPIPKM